MTSAPRGHLPLPNPHSQPSAGLASFPFLGPGALFPAAGTLHSLFRQQECPAQIPLWLLPLLSQNSAQCHLLGWAQRPVPLPHSQVTRFIFFRAFAPLFCLSPVSST